MADDGNQNAQGPDNLVRQEVEQRGKSVKSVAFVTPSYAPDLGRCEILVDSVRHFAPDTMHYLIIDRCDLKAFAHLAGPRTIIVPSEEVMHKSYWRLPGRKGLWLNLRALPLRGWMAQQLLKLGIAQVAGEDILVCLDSDVAFVRPFITDYLYVDGKVGLLDVDYTGGKIPAWTAIAADLLDVPKATCPDRGHVGELIVWQRWVLLEMLARIEASHGLPWQIAVGRKRTFSEYVLYGTFVRCVLGYEQSGHIPSVRPLVRQPWDRDFSTPESIRSFVSDTEPGNIAVMFHSKHDLSAAELRPHFEAAWKRYFAGEAGEILVGRGT